MHHTVVCTHLLVFGRNRFVLLGLAPSRIFRAVRSSGLIFLNVVLILVFGVIPGPPTAFWTPAEAAAAVFVIGVAVVAPEMSLISNSSFKLPFRFRRSSSFQSILPRERRPAAARLLLNYRKLSSAEPPALVMT